MKQLPNIFSFTKKEISQINSNLKKVEEYLINTFPAYMPKIFIPLSTNNVYTSEGIAIQSNITLSLEQPLGAKKPKVVIQDKQEYLNGKIVTYPLSFEEPLPDILFKSDLLAMNYRLLLLVNWADIKLKLLTAIKSYNKLKANILEKFVV